MSCNRALLTGGGLCAPPGACFDYVAGAECGAVHTSPNYSRCGSCRRVGRLAILWAHPSEVVSKGNTFSKCFVESPKEYQVIKMAAQHGGFRKGAGRPKGSRNRATIAREGQQREALASARAANAYLSAIDYLLQILRDPTVPRGLRMKTAMFVAPYLEYQVRVSQSRRGRAK
jgi:hypothetical protein